MLTAHHLQATRDDKVLFTALNFSLAAGQVLQIAGPNGAGKTTLLTMVAGLSALESGQIVWKGGAVDEDVAAFRAESLWQGHLLGLKLMLTARENLRWLLQLRGAVVSAAAIDWALDQVGLYGYENVPLARMSAGQKRRVSLARLLVDKCALWILDEPFTALDKAGVAELENFLRAHIAQGGMALLTTHHEFSVDFPVQRLNLLDFRPERAVECAP